MAHVELKSLSKTFGAFTALMDINLSVGKGELCALLGPSGCGKSTLLGHIAELKDVTHGAFHIADRDVTDLEPSDRPIDMVFRSYTLYPHMTVAENIAFSLEAAGQKKAERLAKATAVAKTLKLDHLLNSRPAMLSVGQRQRVAIGRALVRDPEVFLFDEPLSDLDARLRVQMRVELSNLHHDFAATMSYEKHDQMEAMTMADRIVVMDQGRIQQNGRPVDLGIRPEHAHLVDQASPDTVLPGKVRLVERLGNQTLVHLETPCGSFVLQGGGDLPAKTGDPTAPAFDVNHAHGFDADSSVI